MRLQVPLFILFAIPISIVMDKIKSTKITNSIILISIIYCLILAFLNPNRPLIKNEKQAKLAFEQRIKETKEKAIEENKNNANKYGNIITQDIDQDGNLFGLGILTQESKLSELMKENKQITVDDISKELFEGDDIITKKN